MQEKQKHLLESVRSRKITVTDHASQPSRLAGVWAKGDRRLAPARVEADTRGCVWDGWEECVRYDTWMQVFADLGIDPYFYCQRPIALDEVTPWSHMDYGVTHEYLVREYKKALAAQTTPPCNRQCGGCGANHLQIICWEDPALITVRISFEKKAEASYISLLDLQRVMQRVLKRSGRLKRRPRPPISHCWTCSG